MKKITIIVAQDEIDAVLQMLMEQACVEIDKPDMMSDYQMPGEIAISEDYDVKHLGAAKGTLPLLVTPHTCILFGWVPERLSYALEYQLSRYTASWDIKDPNHEESALAPVRLVCPFFFGKMRLAGRRLFEPFAKAAGNN